MTREGQDVEKSGVEFPKGLVPTDAVGIMESRLFTRGVRLLDFLCFALDPKGLKGEKRDVIKRITMARLHVSSLHNTSASILIHCRDVNVVCSPDPETVKLAPADSVCGFHCAIAGKNAFDKEYPATWLASDHFQHLKQEWLSVDAFAHVC